MKDDRFPHDPSLTATFTPASRQRFRDGLEKYLPYLAGLDCPDELKLEFVVSLFPIVVAIVDAGFGRHPVQEVCGQPEKDGAQAAKTGGDEVNCGATTFRQTFDDVPNRD